MTYALPTDSRNNAIPIFSPHSILNWTLNTSNGRTIAWAPESSNRVVMIQATSQISISLNGGAGFFPIPAGAIIQLGVNNIKSMIVSSSVDTEIYVMVQ